jgi:NAD(P)-dependent dehydrogenase (short-subunit alcohol dehydrogenase family)
VQKRATEELGTKFDYGRIDATDSAGLNEIVERIANEHGRVDGLIAAAGIQQETPSLEYSAADAKYVPTKGNGFTIVRDNC